MVDCRWLITSYREIQTDIQAFVPAAVVLFVYRVWYYEEWTAPVVPTKKAKKIGPVRKCLPDQENW